MLSSTRQLCTFLEHKRYETDEWAMAEAIPQSEPVSLQEADQEGTSCEAADTGVSAGVCCAMKRVFVPS